MSQASFSRPSRTRSDFMETASGSWGAVSRRTTRALVVTSFASGPEHGPSPGVMVLGPPPGSGGCFGVGHSEMAKDYAVLSHMATLLLGRFRRDNPRGDAPPR